MFCPRATIYLRLKVQSMRVPSESRNETASSAAVPTRAYTVSPKLMLTMEIRPGKTRHTKIENKIFLSRSPDRSRHACHARQSQHPHCKPLRDDVADAEIPIAVRPRKKKTPISIEPRAQVVHTWHRHMLASLRPRRLIVRTTKWPLRLHVSSKFLLSASKVVFGGPCLDSQKQSRRDVVSFVCNCFV